MSVNLIIFEINEKPLLPGYGSMILGVVKKIFLKTNLSSYIVFLNSQTNVNTYRYSKIFLGSQFMYQLTHFVKTIIQNIF